MENKTNWLAIVVCIVAGMGLGMLWFGGLFSAQWMAGNGITMSPDGKALKDGVEMPHSMLPYIVNAISLAVYAYIINWLINKTGSGNLKSGAMIGGAIGVISLFGIYTSTRWSGDSISLSMVNGFYTLIMFTIIGAIMGAWRSK